MSGISQEYFDDEDIAPYDDNTQDSDGFAAQSQEEEDDCAGEGSIETSQSNGDGQPIDSSSDAGESDEVSSIADLDPELQEIKGSPAETRFRTIHLTLI
jgi:hypothetical protein